MYNITKSNVIDGVDKLLPFDCKADSNCEMVVSASTATLEYSGCIKLAIFRLEETIVSPPIAIIPNQAGNF